MLNFNMPMLFVLKGYKLATCFLRPKKEQLSAGIHSFLRLPAGQMPEGRTWKFDMRKVEAAGRLNVLAVRQTDG